MERNLRLLLKDFDLRHHNADYTLLLANSYIYFEKFDEAASVLKNYLEKYSFSTGSKIALGEIYQLLGYIEAIRNNKAEAIRWLVKAETVEELGKAELYKLGCLYESMGELGRALRSFQLTL
jgi:tetratricopeptide (TPR) repeat protein